MVRSTLSSTNDKDKDKGEVCTFYPIPTATTRTNKAKANRNKYRYQRKSSSLSSLPILSTTSSSSRFTMRNSNNYVNDNNNNILWTTLSRLRPTRSARMLFQKSSYLHIFLLPAFLILILEMFPPIPHPFSSSSNTIHSTTTSLPFKTHSIHTTTNKPWSPFPKSVHPGTCIVAVCMNRHDTLHKTLPTWLAVQNVSEVILVDWSSEPTLYESISPNLISNPRLKILRVENETQWVLTRAYNLGIHAASRDTVIRTDCDYSLSSDFLSVHPFSQRDNVVDDFYAGNYASARDANEAHLNGAVLIKRNDFLRVGGYDERIQTYGWDDEDLYERLQKNSSDGGAGLRKNDIKFDFVKHVSHADTARAQRDVKFVQVEIDLNSLLLKSLPTWNETTAEHASKQWSVMPRKKRLMNNKDPTKNYAVVTAMLNEAYRPVALKNLVSAREYEDAWKLALGQRLANDYQMPWDIMETMDSETRRLLLTKLNTRASEIAALEQSEKTELTPTIPRMLLVHCMHGLGNRLRAMASALSFANATGRVPVVIWEKDAHIAAVFGDLFETEDIVTLSQFKPKWPFSGYDRWDRSWNSLVSFNYMEMEGDGAIKGQKIDAIAHVNKHIYFKSAYIMQVDDNKLTNWNSDNIQLRTVLKPVKQVIDMVESLGDNLHSMVGIHIRDRTLQRDIQNVDFGAEYGASASTEMQYWRQKSAYRNFIAEMWRMVEKEPDLKFYVATDTVDLFDKLKLEFKDRVVYTPRLCDGRDGKCIRYALVDLLCLAKTKQLVGSNWSSFTEAASRFGGKKPRLSGVDFAREGKTSVSQAEVSMQEGQQQQTLEQGIKR